MCLLIDINLKNIRILAKAKLKFKLYVPPAEAGGNS